MSRILHIDGSQGASGDMILGALIDLGFPLAQLRSVAQGPGLEAVRLRSQKLSRCGLVGTKVDVRVRGHEADHDHHAMGSGHGRSRREIRRIIGQVEIPARPRRRALAIFERLVEAEARAHGIPAERVHLHEAGMLDAIVDVLGAVLGLEYLGVDRIIVSPLTTGWGEIRCAHGTYPVPAPAVIELLRGIALRAGEIETERLTPTGAAILVELADAWGPVPLLTPDRVGYGAGSRDLGSTPNMLRMVLGQEEVAASSLGEPAEIVVVECSLDDATPQLIAHVADRLRAAGALDVHLSATMMKKGRIGELVTVLARPELFETVVGILLSETPTLGVRFRTERRIELIRQLRSVPTVFGNIRVKFAEFERTTKVWPEYDDCAAAAQRHRVPLQVVQRAALEAATAAPAVKKTKKRNTKTRRAR